MNNACCLKNCELSYEPRQEGCVRHRDDTNCSYWVAAAAAAAASSNTGLELGGYETNHLIQKQ